MSDYLNFVLEMEKAKSRKIEPCNTTVEDHHMIVTIKGVKKKQRLNKCGHPETVPGLESIMVQGYVASEFRDLMKELADLKRVEVFCGKKKIFDFKY
jgi:hypothetical protein